MKKIPPPGYEYYDGLILPCTVADEAVERYDVRVTDAARAEQERRQHEEDRQSGAIGSDDRDVDKATSAGDIAALVSPAAEKPALAGIAHFSFWHCLVSRSEQQQAN